MQSVSEQTKKRLLIQTLQHAVTIRILYRQRKGKRRRKRRRRKEEKEEEEKKEREEKEVCEGLQSGVASLEVVRIIIIISQVEYSFLHTEHACKCAWIQKCSANYILAKYTVTIFCYSDDRRSQKQASREVGTKRTH